jgi:deazaflavin-dependent oxidoreductase (nitroreductase family)
VNSAVVDEVGVQLAAWGKVARVETRGRRSGQPLEVAVGFIEEPDGSILVAAGSPDAAWARNIEAEPRCRVHIEAAAFDAVAQVLGGADRARAIRELILKYGTPAERLGRGAVFRLLPGREST